MEGMAAIGVPRTGGTGGAVGCADPFTPARREAYSSERFLALMVAFNDDRLPLRSYSSVI